MCESWGKTIETFLQDNFSYKKIKVISHYHNCNSLILKPTAVFSDPNEIPIIVAEEDEDQHLSFLFLGVCHENKNV